LQEIQANPKRNSPNQLQAFPFPATDMSAAARRTLYQRHRQRVIGMAGTAIFLFGNKRNKRGTIVPADGMIEEFSIAKAAGLHIIPVGATGWIAGEIAAEVAPLLSGRSASFRKALSIANNPASDIAAIVKAALTMANDFRNS
jgi:hypothetical protein